MKIKEQTQKLLMIVRGVLEFIRVFVAPIDKVESVCSAGHSLLKGWPHCPDCKIQRRNDDQQRLIASRRVQPPSLGLHCFAGAHQGQMILFSQDQVKVGSGAESDLVLTAENLSTVASHQLLINGRITLTSAENETFKVNGQTHQMATLFDFDEVEILDNRFLVMEIKTPNGAPHVH